MKIRKFNESVESIDRDYITECFIDMIDDGKIKFYDKENHYRTVTQYAGTAYVNKNYDGDPFESYREYYINCNNIIDSVEECIEKVKIKYPDIKFSFSIIGNTMEIIFK